MTASSAAPVTAKFRRVLLPWLLRAGVSALVAALYLGPRSDFRRMPLAPHNVPLVLLGAGLLWFGWFGFNAGSATAAGLGYFLGGETEDYPATIERPVPVQHDTWGKVKARYH